jgi:hypothetical protein
VLQDVDQLLGFLRNRELGEEVIKKALDIFGNLHQQLQVQEHLVQAVLSVRVRSLSPAGPNNSLDQGPLTLTFAHMDLRTTQRQASNPFSSLDVKEEEGSVAPAILAQLFAALCSDYVLDALFLHAALPQVHHSSRTTTPSIYMARLGSLARRFRA